MTRVFKKLPSRETMFCYFSSLRWHHLSFATLLHCVCSWTVDEAPRHRSRMDLSLKYRNHNTLTFGLTDIADGFSLLSVPDNLCGFPAVWTNTSVGSCSYWVGDECFKVIEYLVVPCSGFQKPWGGGGLLDSTHNTPIFSDIFYGGSVSVLACESLRRH